MRTANDILEDLINTIEATGGIVWIDGIAYPEGDRDWVDLADVYTEACKLLGKKPMENFGEEGDDNEY